MRSYVSYKKATILFCLRPMFPFKAIAWNNKLYNDGGSSIGSGGNNKGRQHITFDDELHAPFNHIIIIISRSHSLSFSLFLSQSLHPVLSHKRSCTPVPEAPAECRLVKTNEHFVEECFFRKSSRFLLCRKPPTLSAIFRKGKEKEYNITHSFPYHFPYINLNTHVFKYQINATRYFHTLSASESRQWTNENFCAHNIHDNSSNNNRNNNVRP